MAKNMRTTQNSSFLDIDASAFFTGQITKRNVVRQRKKQKKIKKNLLKNIFCWIYKRKLPNTYRYFETNRIEKKLIFKKSNKNLEKVKNIETNQYFEEKYDIILKQKKRKKQKY